MPYLFSLTFILILVAYTALLKYADLEQYIKMMVWPISLSVLTHITVCFVVAFIYLGTDTTSLKVFLSSRGYGFFRMRYFKTAIPAEAASGFPERVPA